MTFLDPWWVSNFLEAPKLIRPDLHLGKTGLVTPDRLVTKKRVRNCDVRADSHSSDVSGVDILKDNLWALLERDSIPSVHPIKYRLSTHKPET